MKGWGLVKCVLASLAVAGFCVPQAAFAEGAGVNSTPSVTDIELLAGNVLVGQVVDAQGAAVTRIPVSLRAQQREVALTKTDDNGYFAVSQVRGGVHQVVVPEGQGTYRVWAQGTAPPYAQKGAKLVCGRKEVQGQCLKSLGRVLASPYVIAVVVAAAVAIPTALSGNPQPSSP